LFLSPENSAQFLLPSSLDSLARAMNEKNKNLNREASVAKKEMKQESQKQTQNTVIQFDSVKRTKNGWAIFVGRNVIFLNDGLTSWILKNQKKAS
jgi:hypothetical protein